MSGTSAPETLQALPMRDAGLFCQVTGGAMKKEGGGGRFLAPRIIMDGACHIPECARHLVYLLPKEKV